MILTIMQFKPFILLCAYLFRFFFDMYIDYKDYKLRKKYIEGRK